MTSYSALAGSAQPEQSSHTFSGIFEPSGLIHLGEGEFILIEDEAEHPLHLVKLDHRGVLKEAGEISQSGESIKLIDLEGIAFDGQFIYVITSHSLNKKGKAPKGRSVLARYNYQQGELKASGRVRDLKAPIITLLNKRYPHLDKQQLQQQLNIEALSWSGASQRLYIGLRAPVIEGKSLIIRIDQASGLFEQGSAVDMRGEILTLDLGGVGIRAMSRDRQTNQFIIVAGDKKKGDGQFAAWSWQDKPDARPLKLRDLKKGTEGLAGFEFRETTGWLLLRDNGKRNKHKPAHYQVLPRLAL